MSLTHIDLFLSLKVILNIVLSIDLCAFLSDHFQVILNFQVLHLYFIPGINHSLYTLHFKLTSKVIFITSQLFLNAFYPIIMCCFISFLWSYILLLHVWIMYSRTSSRSSSIFIFFEHYFGFNYVHF